MICILYTVFRCSRQATPKVLAFATSPWRRLKDREIRERLRKMMTGYLEMGRKLSAV
jgi:hypothetical protein